MSIKTAIIEGNSTYLSDLLSDTSAEPSDISSGSIPEGFDCALVSQSFSGEKTAGILRDLQKRGIPAGVVTDDFSCDNQRMLCDMGADDVITLPICKDLLEKRVSLLAGKNGVSDFSFIEKVSLNQKAQGSFIVREREFSEIYSFVVRILERLGQKAQLIIFSVSSRFGAVIEPEIMHDFITVVERSLRKGDISSQHGDQLFVMLIGADEHGGQTVAKRLIETYWSLCDDDAYDITYEIKEIRGQ